MQTQTSVFQVLGCGRSVPQQRYLELKEHLWSRAPHLEPCRAYNLKQICTQAFHRKYGAGVTIQGLIMADLVRTEQVPFEFASDPDSKPYFYRLKNDYIPLSEEESDDS